MSEIGLKPFMCSSIDSSMLRSEWEKWKRGFKIYAEANDIVDQKKLRSKLLHIGGLELQEIYFGIQGPQIEGNEEANVYDVAIAKLDEYFSPKRNSVFERYVFKTMKMNEGETFDQFLIRVKHQAQKCDFGDDKEKSKEINIIDKIIEVAPNDIKKVLLEKELTLSDVVATYNMRSQIQTQAKAMSNKEVQSVCRISQSAAPSFSNVRCYKCQKNGHIAKQCWSKNRPKIIQKSQKGLSSKCMKCGYFGHLAVDCGKRKLDEVSKSVTPNKRFKSSYVRNVGEIESEDDGSDEVGVKEKLEF